MSTGGAKRGCPSLWREEGIQEFVWIVLLAMEGEEEGVSTAAIDSSKFFDMIVWVFPLMAKMGVPDQVWKLQASFVSHLKRFFRWQSCGETWKALNGVVQGCSQSLVTDAHVTGLWMDGMSQQVLEIKGTTMVDNRRLYAVGTENFRTFEEAIEYTTCFDDEVGNKFTSKKSTVADDRTARPKQGCKETRIPVRHERETSGIPAGPREAKGPRGATRGSCQGDDHDKQNLHDQKHLHF